MLPKRSVLIVDDHPIVRMGISRVLQDSEKLMVCGEAATVAEARAQVLKYQPDFIILDLMLGGRDGIEMIKEFSELHPQGRILVYSSFDEKIYALKAVKAGASGYLMKRVGIKQLRDALETMADGEGYVSAEVQKKVVQDFLVGKKKTPARVPLSDREEQILNLLGRGMGSSEIATELHLSMKTVGTYRERIKDKLNLENARDLERHAEKWVRHSAGVDQ